LPEAAPWLLLLIAATFFPQAARALDPNCSISRYIHNQWGSEQGFPGGTVNAIAQTSDGYLWIGSELGLVRFDGVSFIRVSSPALPEGPVPGLAVDAEGSLWIRSQGHGLTRYRRGDFQQILADSMTDSPFTAMGPGVMGSVLCVRFTDPIRFDRGKMLHILPRSLEGANRLAISTAETSDGTVWIGTRDEGLFALRHGVVSALKGLPDLKVNCLLPEQGSQLWVGTDKGLVRWNGEELTERGVPSSLRRIQVLSLAHDRDSNVWAGSSAGIVRIDVHGVSSGVGTAGEVNALFEDREGNLWVGGTDGIERYRDSLFLTYARGRRSGDGGPLYVDESGRTWFGPSEGGLAWQKGSEQGKVAEAGLSNDVVYSIDGGPGEVWIGRQRGGLTRLRLEDGLFGAETYTAANGLAPGSVYAVRRSRDGTVWAGTLNGGVSCWRNGRLTTYSKADGLVSNTTWAIEEGADGTVWFATPNGLESFAHDRWQAYENQDSLPPARVNCLQEDSAGVLWIGTDAGLAFIQAGRLQMPRNLPRALLENIAGIVDDRSGYLWIATTGSVVRVARAYLLGDAPAESAVREFGPEDGIPAAAGVRRCRSVVGDGSGRVWLSLRGGISAVTPARLAAGPVPAIVHIRSVTADGHSLNPSLPLHIPASRQRITLSFIGLSLSVPDRVRYRYRLDGFDHDWSDAGAAREAVYTNLSPGSYRFRVIANNSEGVWNSAEAAVGLEIVPAFWQTLWFRFAIVAACMAAIAGIYRLRLHHLTDRLNVRFEERLAERTRIAQELHDTLLQGFLSASMQVHVAADRLPEDSAVRPTLIRALEVMRQVIEEGRNTLRGLRSPGRTSLDLSHAFSQIQQELGRQGTEAKGPEFRVIVEGEKKALQPILRDEVYKIGREALINAFRHSRASHVEIELRYTPSTLSLFVRDDGSGIDPRTLQTGREGHWGLAGMRERADRIGARLHVRSSVSAGTEIELDIPGEIAFENRPGHGFTWLGRNGRAK
jgi:signal transduction histidine kinase/ligand-binding sensor domain-containing protein